MRGDSYRAWAEFPVFGCLQTTGWDFGLRAPPFTNRRLGQTSCKGIVILSPLSPVVVTGRLNYAKPETVRGSRLLDWGPEHWKCSAQV